MKARRIKDAPRSRILAIAKQEFARKGFSGTRMSDIASGAGVNSALIHYYFKNKQNLYMEVLKLIIHAEFGSDFSVIPENTDYTTSEKVHALIYFIFKSSVEINDDEGMRIFLWEMAEGGKYIEDLVSNFFEPRMNLSIQLIKEGIESGEFRNIDPVLLIISMQAFIFMFFIQYRSVIESMVQGIKSEEMDHVYLFLRNSVFSQLLPHDRKEEIPDIPPKLKVYLDEVIDVIKRAEDPEKTYAMVNNLKKVLASQ